MIAGLAILAAWLLIIIIMMVLRAVHTPPGRPDAFDGALILATPLVCALAAKFSRSRVLVWCLAFPVLVGAWYAWNDNTRLYLQIAFRGWWPQIKWWLTTSTWVLVGGRVGASIAWKAQDRRTTKRRNRRLADGLCPQCGYDLRATPDPLGPRLPRCPECGNVVQSASKDNSA